MRKSELLTAGFGRISTRSGQMLMGKTLVSGMPLPGSVRWNKGHKRKREPMAAEEARFLFLLHEVADIPSRIAYAELRPQRRPGR